jgi:hypothetical protein
VQVQRFQGIDQVPDQPDDFGEAIAIDARTALIGAPNDGTGETGAAYVFERGDNGTPGDPLDDSWLLVEKLVPGAHVTTIPMRFGSAVALQEGAALVGTSTWTEGYVFVHGRDDAGTPGDALDDHWIDIGELHGDLELDDHFGVSIAMSGDLTLVGALQQPFVASGKVHVFHRDAGGTPGDPLDDVWTETFQLVPGDGTEGFGTCL